MRCEALLLRHRIATIADAANLTVAGSKTLSANSKVARSPAERPVLPQHPRPFTRRLVFSLIRIGR